MLNKWDRWYAGLTEPEAYGDTVTYEEGARWLTDCAQVADWGCGKGWLRRFVGSDCYVGIDGSASPFADVIADLRTYQAPTEGVFMRHVLEHNYDWPAVLANACASASERLFLALFTPLADQTTEIAYAEDPGVPDISFALADLTVLIENHGLRWDAETVATATQYGTETMIRCER